MHQSRRAFLLIFYIGKYRKSGKIAFSCFKHPKWRCLSKFHTRCHRARCQRQGGHWYWNYWKILKYTGKIFHTGIILEKYFILELYLKTPTFYKNLKNWKIYWNFEILILENTGIFLTRLTKWTSHYSTLNFIQMTTFEYISLKT